MTNLRKLKVSLTKHGAHKLAHLLKKYDKDEVLEHLWDSEPGINIERAQALRNLSADEVAVPPVWNVAKERGSEAVDALVLVAIIFSHHQLISAMQNSAAKAPFAGTIIRGNDVDGKAFTNFAHIIEELGYSTEHSTDHVRYDLHKLFQITGLNELVLEVLTLKLTAAGWDRKNPLLEEISRLQFCQAFSVSDSQLRRWLVAGTINGDDNVIEDSEFFLAQDDTFPSGPFVFQPGHKTRKSGTVKVNRPEKESTATLFHNALQNSLFVELVAEYGKECVGTENNTGQGTIIDIVVKTDEFCWFYEIKTAPSVKACIRQAIPQLLEYAYWLCDIDRADQLIIVSSLPITKEAEKYLKFLNEHFKMPIGYLQHIVQD